MNKWTSLTWPDQARSSPNDIRGRCGWRIKAAGSKWRVCPDESYERRRAGLLKVVGVHAGPSEPPEDLIRRIRGWNREMELDPELERDLAVETHRLNDIGTNAARDLAIGGQFGLLSGTDLDGIARAILESDLHWIAIEMSAKCSARVSVIRMLFSVDHAGYVLQRPAQFRGFDAMRALLGDYFQSPMTFLEPALLCISPWLVGSAFNRLHGVLVGIGSCPQDGRPQYSEAMARHRPLLLADVMTDVRERPDVSHREGEAFLRWWVDRVDELLSAALDPVCGVNEGGEYDARIHLAGLNTVARLFATVHDILFLDRYDQFARPVLLFQFLDLMHGLRYGDYDQTTSLGRCERVLRDVVGALPPAVRAYTLPRCERAVTALKEVRAGFDPDLILSGELHFPDGTTIGLEKATSALLRSIRNSQHGQRSELGNDRHLKVLAAHNGRLSPDLADLAFLHLVQMLTTPEELRWRISARRQPG